MSAEVAHGIARRLLLEPLVGDFRARQIAVFSGSLVILTVACLTAPWIPARSSRWRLAIGSGWVALTVIFEVCVGRWGLDYSWARIASDYDVTKGGLLPLGLVVMGLAPTIAARLRRNASAGP